MKKFFLSLLVGALVLGAGIQGTFADSPGTNLKPVAVVSLAGYDALLADVGFVGKLGDNPELGVGLEAMLKLFTKGQGLAGLDKTRPWGAVALNNADNFYGYAFLPVSDLEKLGAVVEPFIGKAENQGNGVYKLNTKQKPTFVKEGKGWAFFSDKAENLANLPEDPLALLGGLNKEYDIALRLNVENVPENLRAKFLEEMNKGAARDAAKRWNESDEEFALRSKVTAEILRGVQQAIADAKNVTVGWKLDTQAEKSYLEASVTAKPGTPTATQMAAMKDSQSKYSGFRMADAGVCGNWVGQIPKVKAELLDNVIEAVQKKALGDMEKKEQDARKVEVGKKIVNQLAALLRESVKSGRVDGGMALMLKPEAVTFVSGGYAANNGKIEELAKYLTDAVTAENPIVGSWIKLNADELQGVKFHTVSIPLPYETKDRAKVAAMIGETIEIVIGTSNDSVYLAAGREPLKTLKQAVERSAGAATSKTVPPLELKVSLESLASFLAVVGADHERPKAAKLAEELKKSAGADHLTLTAEPIADGVKYRLEVEKGILQAIGKMR